MRKHFLEKCVTRANCRWAVSIHSGVHTPSKTTIYKIHPLHYFYQDTLGLLSCFILLFLVHNWCALLYPSLMAQVSIVRALMLVFVVAIFSAAATVSAQDVSPAPAPSPDAGSAFSVPFPYAVIASSLILSLFALLKPWVTIYNTFSDCIAIRWSCRVIVSNSLFFIYFSHINK